MATKQDLYDAIDILSAVYFNGKEEKQFYINKARYYWLKDKRRNPLAYPRYILINAAEAIVSGSTVSGAHVGIKHARFIFYHECNSMVMSEANKLIKFPCSSDAKDALIRWSWIAKNAGLLLTLDKINERLAEYGDD